MSSFSQKTVRLLKPMMIAQSAEQPTVIHTLPSRNSWLGTPSRIIRFIQSPKKTLRAESQSRRTSPRYTTSQRIIGKKNDEKPLMTQKAYRKIGTGKCQYQKSTHNLEKSSYPFYTTPNRRERPFRMYHRSKTPHRNTGHHTKPVYSATYWGSP